MNSKLKDALTVLGMLGICVAFIATCWIFNYHTEHKDDVQDVSYNWVDNIEIHYQAKIIDGKKNNSKNGWHQVRRRDLQLVSSRFSTAELKNTTSLIDSMVINMINERKQEIETFKQHEIEKQKREEIETKNKVKSNLKAKGCIEKEVDGKVFIACPVN